jgi:hypothetical protein
VLRDAEKKTIGFVLWSQLTKFITAIPGHHSFVGRRILEAAIANQIEWRTITGYERTLFLNSPLSLREGEIDHHRRRHYYYLCPLFSEKSFRAAFGVV